MNRPRRVVVVLGTGTEIGKTWVACRLLEAVRSTGASVAARKPAQSFAPEDAAAGVPTDADLLGAATGEPADRVCLPGRCYPLALAPPMAADRLGTGRISLDDLLDELRWPAGVDLGLVETAGGVRSPIAHDGDGATLAHRLAPDLAVLVADAGLGTINAVRSAIGALASVPTVVMLNRFDPGDPLHTGNRDWLVGHDECRVVTDVDALATLVLPDA